VADETSILSGLNARFFTSLVVPDEGHPVERPRKSAQGIFLSGLALMALGAVIHFHPVPGITAEAGNIFAPYIPAVSRDSIFLIGLGGL
jgi:hypothetical protein